MTASAGGIRAGGAFVELFARDKLSEGLARAAGNVKKFAEGVRGVGEKVFEAGGAITAGFGGALRVFVDAGSELAAMSKRTGASVESLSTLGFAAERSGVGMEELDHSFRHMAKAVTEAAGGSGEMAAALAELGTSAAELQALRPDDQFRRLGAALGAVSDPTKRAALAMQIFGRGGTELLPLFSEGADGIAKLEQHARDLGVTMSGADAQSAREFGGALKDLWAQLRAAAAQVGAALAPELIDLVKWFSQGAATVIKFVRDNRALIVVVAQVAAGIAAAGAAIVAVGAVIGAIGTAFAALSAVVGFAVSLFSFLISPIGLVIAGVIALGGAILHFTGAGGQALGWLGERFASFKETALAAWGGIKDALAAGDLALAARVAWAGVKYAVLANTVGIQEAWVNFSSFLLGVWARIKAYVLMGWVTLKAYALDFVAGVSDGWTRLAADAQAAWARIVAFFKPAVDTMATLWDHFVQGFTKAWSFAVRLAARLLAPLLRAGLKVGIKGTGAALAGVNSAVAEAAAPAAHRIGRVSEGAAGERQQIADQLQKDLAQIEQDRQSRLAGVGTGVEDAKKELDAALAEAKAAAAAAAAKNTGAAVANVPTAGQAAGLAAGKVDVQGTFSASAVAGLGSNKVIDRIAEQTKEMVKEQKATNKKLDALQTVT